LITNTVLQLSRSLGGRVIHHVDDVYPDLATAIGSLPPRGPAPALLDRIARAGLKNCDQVIALGECMAKVLKVKGVPADRLAVAPPWADGSQLQPLAHADNEFRRELGIPDDYLVVMYAGNMGQGHRFETILGAAYYLAPDPEVRFVFIGDGAKRHQIETFRTSHNLKNILMLPYQPRQRLRQTLAAGDLHLISLNARVQGLIVPSKLAGILAVGRPVVFLGSEQNSVAEAILRSQCGTVIPEGDVGQLTRTIRDFVKSPEHRRRMGLAGRKLFEQEFDRRVVVPQIISRVENNSAQRR
jgi:colanic acid biosynthesis glycosyl transferase WcaI